MFVLIVATFGLILSIFVAILFKKKRVEIDKKLDLLEELE
jgi:Co/Zn/Cd efflux system component